MLTYELFPTSDRIRAIDQLHAATAIYTREPVVDQLLDLVEWPHMGKSLLDTSCGDGVFLGRALERLLAAKPDLSDETLAGRIAGWEIHECASNEARARVQRVLQANGRSAVNAASLAASIVTCGDFLTDGPSGRFDTIVGNPPYLRYANVPEPLRSDYRNALPPYARADLLHSFISRSADMLKPGGRVALVTADRWLFNSGAAQLREVIGKRLGLEHLRRLDCSTSFYRPKQRRSGTPPRVHPVAVVLRPGGAMRLGQEAIFPSAAQKAQGKGGLTLGDIAEVRLAPWLGTPGVFLVDEHAAAGLPFECLVPAIDTDDIRQGILASPRRFAIITRPGERPCPEILAHLEREMPRMCERGRRRGRLGLPPEPFHRFDLSVPSLLVPRIAKRLSPIRIPPGMLPVNHNLSIVRAGSHSLDDLQRLLNSDAALEWFHESAAPLENGYRSLTTRLLRTMPIVT